jgi:uncharacterized membrane protein YkvA (DUF1232 family)
VSRPGGDGIDVSRALVPRAGDEARVRSGFREKMLRFAAKIPFASDVVALYIASRDPATPTRTKALMLAALSYFVLPTDAIPDIFLGVGFTDDAAVIAAMVALAGSAIKPRHREQAKAWLSKVST